MSFTEILEELAVLTPEERQQIVDRIDEIDDFQITPEIQAELDRRWQEHLQDPKSAIPAEQVIANLRAKFAK